MTTTMPYLDLVFWRLTDDRLGINRTDDQRAEAWARGDSSGWYLVHDNLVTLTSWMADNSYDASEVARAVEKPWSYEDEFKQAQAAC